jgi:hypothetical protein
MAKNIENNTTNHIHYLGGRHRHMLMAMQTWLQNGWNRCRVQGLFSTRMLQKWPQLFAASCSLNCRTADALGRRWWPTSPAKRKEAKGPKPPREYKKETESHQQNLEIKIVEVLEFAFNSLRNQNRVVILSLYVSWESSSTTINCPKNIGFWNFSTVSKHTKPNFSILKMTGPLKNVWRKKKRNRFGCESAQVP